VIGIRTRARAIDQRRDLNTLVKAVLDLLVAHQIIPDKATALVGQR